MADAKAIRRYRVHPVETALTRLHDEPYARQRTDSLLVAPEGRAAGPMG
jgi:hypothetical protein